MLRQELEKLIASGNNIQINFPAAAGGKLVSISGTLKAVGEDYVTMQDIYGNTQLIPSTSIAYFEIKK